VLIIDLIKILTLHSVLAVTCSKYIMQGRFKRKNCSKQIIYAILYPDNTNNMIIVKFLYLCNWKKWS